MRSQIQFVIIIVTISIAGTVFVYRSTNAIAAPDPPETHAVITALEDAITVLDKPFEELDLTELSTVLINDPNYAKLVPPDELRELKDYTRKIQGEDALSGFGYLTVMQTKRLSQQNGARLLREARAKAKAANRTVTMDEIRHLTELNFGVEPYVPDKREQSLAQPFIRQLDYLSIKIEDNRAEIIFDDMVKVRKALLLWANGRWYVADIS